jgi:hypothetical protein
MFDRRLWPVLILLATLLGGATTAGAESPAVAGGSAAAQDDAWRGEYFNNRYLAGHPVSIRADPEIDFDFGYGSPGPGIGADYFSARWTRMVYFPTTGTYEFGARTDDGVRVWVDGQRVIDDWGPRQGQWALGEIFLTAGLHTVRMTYYEGEGWAQAHLGWRLLAGEGGWMGEYYANESLSGTPALSREDERIAFEWGTSSPDPALPPDGFSARWRRSVYFNAGTYRFLTLTDDGVRFWVDGSAIIDAWYQQERALHEATLALKSGNHTLQVDYFERGGEATAHAWWEPVQIAGDGAAGGWLGQYFSNRYLDGPPIVVRNDPEINFNWGEGPPDPAMPRDNFTVRWTRTVSLSRGTWRFYAEVDDGVRIWANDHSVIYQWIETDNGIYQADLSLVEGGTFTVTVEYFEATGFARAHVWFERIDPEPR